MPTKPPVHIMDCTLEDVVRAAAEQYQLQLGPDHPLHQSFHNGLIQGVNLAWDVLTARQAWIQRFYQDQLVEITSELQEVGRG